MKVTLSKDGATIDANDLGPLLGISPAKVPEKMRTAEITSLSEEGEGEDAGRTRLTFWYAGKRVRIVCDADGNVIKTSRSSALRGAR